MKIKTLLLLTASLLMGACKSNDGGNNNGETTENNGSNKVYDPIVANSKWGVEAAQACYETIGTVIPYFESDGFDYEVTVDDYGDPAIWFYLYYETEEIAEAKIVEYAYAAYEQDQYECVVQPERFYDYETYSTWEQTVLHADKSIEQYRAVEIVGLESIKQVDGKGKACIGLFCFNYIPNPDPTSFPDYAVMNVIGRNNVLPKFSTVPTGLNYSFKFFLMEGAKCIEIVVTSTTYSIDLEEKYFYELLDAGYMIAQYDELEQDYTGETFLGTGEYPEFADNYSYYSLSPSQDYIVYFDYDINAQAFYIDVMPGHF